MKTIITSSLFISTLMTYFTFGTPVLFPYKCWLWDSTCMTAFLQALVPTIIAGCPELGLEPLDPMPLHSMHIDQEGLKVDWDNILVHGLKRNLIENVSFDTDRKLCRVMFFSNFSVEAHYKTDGSFYSMPIVGDGAIMWNYDNLLIEFICPYEIIKNENGLSILDLKSYDYWYDTKGDLNCHFENMYDGNEELSQKLHTFVNQNNKIIVKKYGRYLLDMINDKLFDATRTYLRSVPLETFALF